MSFYILGYAVLFYFVPMIAFGDNTTVATKNSPGVNCEYGVCVLKTTGTDFELAAEMLEKNIGPDVIIINLNETLGDIFSIGRGVVVVGDPEELARLVSAILSKTAILDPFVYTNEGNRRGFLKNIRDSRDGTVLGVVNVDRPTPDPDTRFAILAEDPVLDGIPADLRLEIDPVALIPSSTEGCDINKCNRLNDRFRDPSYVYVVYAGIQHFNGCRDWKRGQEHPTTASYRPEELSTLEYRAGAAPMAKTMDLADLPCPPSGVADVYKPGAPYYPILLPPFNQELGKLVDGQYTSHGWCEIAAIRDPPVHAHLVGRISGPKDGGDTFA
ncbi:MAG: hypothetical protein Q9204_006844 [Flavoplaca sp. TL-2023a]